LGQFCVWSVWSDHRAVVDLTNTGTASYLLSLFHLPITK
jgi:hypothetical protein